MTRDEFIRDHRAELDGWVLDAAMSGRQGVELSLHLRILRAKIETKLGAMYDALAVKEPIKNGTPTPLRK